MAIRSFEDFNPKIPESVYVDQSAQVIGNVIIGADSSIWPGAVIRGDIHLIQIGRRTSIQDNSVIHVTHAGPYNPEGFSTVVGCDVIVGHHVILHGCTISDQSLIGMGSIIMDGAVIESEVILAAGSLVPPGKVLEGGHLWMGSPVKCVRKLKGSEFEQIRYSADYYVKLKDRHLQSRLI